MEELYDTDADPDNVENLISDPSYAAHADRLSKALDAWQIDHYDSGLIPESELVRRSEAAGKTIYELVRDPEHYDLKAYQHMAGLALEQDPENLPIFHKGLRHADSGVRFWSVVGCFNLQGTAALDLEKIEASLRDDSHHVRAMAAWILYRAGDRASAIAAWNQLLRESSYASLKIFNIIDWIGEGTEPYVEAMQACAYDYRGYVARMKRFMDIEP